MSSMRCIELENCREPDVRQAQRKRPWLVVLSFSLFHPVEFSGSF